LIGIADHRPRLIWPPLAQPNSLAGQHLLTRSTQLRLSGPGPWVRETGCVYESGPGIDDVGRTVTALGHSAQETVVFRRGTHLAVGRAAMGTLAR
jgi:hypothetical protein